VLRVLVPKSPDTCELIDDHRSSIRSSEVKSIKIVGSRLKRLFLAITNDYTDNVTCNYFYRTKR